MRNDSESVMVTLGLMVARFLRAPEPDSLTLKVGIDDMHMR